MRSSNTHTHTHVKRERGAKDKVVERRQRDNVEKQNAFGFPIFFLSVFSWMRSIKRKRCNGKIGGGGKDLTPLSVGRAVGLSLFSTD